MYMVGSRMRETGPAKVQAFHPMLPAKAAMEELGMPAHCH